MSLVEFRPNASTAGPPVNLDAEAGIIGAALADNTVIDRLDRLEARHFSDGAFSRAWATLQLVHADGLPADVVNVAAKMGGDPATRALLFDLWDNGTPAVADSYADLLIELHQRRQIITLAQAATEAAGSGIASAKVIGDLEASLLALTTKDRRIDLVSAAKAADEVLADLDNVEGDEGAVQTGLKPLDDLLGPMLPDDLVLLAGRPGMGKSALAGCICLNAARAGVGVIEVNGEMNAKQMMRRHLVDLCFSKWGPRAPTYKDIRRRHISDDQRRMLLWARDEVACLPLYMVKRTGLTLGALRALVRRQSAIWASEGIRLGLITVDHVGLLQGETGGRDRYTDQTSIAIGMKAMADELKIPVIALVQLSRQVENRDVKRPILSDLRDSGAWEENADIVIGVYRDAYYAMKEPEPTRGKDIDAKWAAWSAARNSKDIDAIILKVREGEEGTATLWASIGHNAIRATAPEGDLL